MPPPSSMAESLSELEKGPMSKGWTEGAAESQPDSPVSSVGNHDAMEKGGVIQLYDDKTATGSPAADAASTTSTEDSDPDPPPDGGWGAWSMCICAHIVLANTWGFVNSFGIFQAFYADYLSLPPSQISWIGSVQVFLAFFLSTFSGRVSDAGYFRTVFAVGTGFQVVAIFGTSLCSRYWQLMLAQGVCTGIASGLLCCPIMSVTSTYFRRRRALAFGIMTCGNVTGGLVFPAMARQLLPTVGFGWALRAIGFIQGACLLACNLVARTRVKPNATGPLVELAAFKELEYTFYSAAMFFNLAGTFTAWYYIASFGRTAITPTLSYPDSLNLMLVLNGIGILGRLGSAALADRLGPLNIMLPAALASSLCCFGWIGVGTPGAMYAWAAVFGIASGGLQALFPAGLMSLTRDLSKAGMRMGMCFTIVGFCVLSGPPVAGALIERLGGRYVGGQAFAASFLLVGAGFIAASRRVKTGGKWIARI